MRHFCGDVTQVQAFLEAPTFRRAAGDVMLTTASVHLKFANHGVGYLLSQRGDASYGLGGWWSIEVGGTRGTFCIENCIEKVSFWKAPAPQVYHQGGPNGPEVTESGIADFGQTFPRRIHAFLEDITNKAPLSAVRASGRDALAVLEYTFAIIESYENGGAAVEPHPLPAVV
jgi:predicted dehydrogenase